MAGLLAFALIRSRPKLLAAAGAALAPLPLSYGALLVLRLELPAIAMGPSLLLVGAARLLPEARAERARAAAGLARIAELERMAREIEELRREEAEARRVVTHELKTPLTSVRGLAQLLGGFDLTEDERQRVAAMVVTEPSRLSDMVEALLDLEALKLKDFSRTARPTDLSRLVGDRLAALRAGSGREIRGEVDAEVRVLGDPALLSRVVDNLFGNALKFSADGALVTIRVARDGHDALLEVEDGGPGIPDDERERIFRRIERGGAPDAVPGLGLCLALVAEVVAWHHGRVEVESGTKAGSRFRVRLPLPG